MSKRIDLSKVRNTKVEIDGVLFTLRPMPFSYYGLPDNDEYGEPVFTMRTAWSLFEGCVVSWEGLEDKNGQPIPVTKENKRLVFDYVEDLRDPLLKEINKLNEIAEDEVKNLPSSRNGKTTKEKTE